MFSLTKRSPAFDSPEETVKDKICHLYTNKLSTVGGACMHTHSYLTLCDPRHCRYHALLSLGIPRQYYGSGLPFPSPGDLPEPGTKLGGVDLHCW